MPEPDSTDDRTVDESPTLEPDDAAPASCRYATLALTRGETVLYDRQNPRAWLRSDAAVFPASMA